MPGYILDPPSRPTPMAPEVRRPRNDEIFGRDRIVQKGHQLVTKHRQNLLILDPRRMGKTVTMHRMIHLLPPGWLGVYGDFEGISSRTDAIEHLGQMLSEHKGIRKRLGDALKGWFTEAEINPGVFRLTLRSEWKDSPLQALIALLTHVNNRLAENDERLLVAWDEAPMMLQGIHRTEGAGAVMEMMGMLRNVQEDRSLDRVQWVITGSVGFHHVLRAAGQTTGLLNHLEPFGLGPLDDDWAVWLAESYLAGLGATADTDAAETLAAASGNIPYLMRVVATNLGPSRPVTAQMVEDAVETTVTDIELYYGMRHFFERVAPYYGDHANLAETLLSATCDGSVHHVNALSTSLGADRRVLVDVLGWLRDDHYLKVNLRDGTVQWRYPALAAIWARGKGAAP